MILVHRNWHPLSPFLSVPSARRDNDQYEVSSFYLNRDYEVPYVLPPHPCAPFQCASDRGQYQTKKPPFSKPFVPFGAKNDRGRGHVYGGDASTIYAIISEDAFLRLPSPCQVRYWLFVTSKYSSVERKSR